MLKISLSSALVLLLAGAAAAQTSKPQAPAAAAPAPAPSSLPGGASSIQETFDDWRVICASSNGTRQCMIQQLQSDAKTGQLVLAAKLAPSKGAASGEFVMPFGLLFEAGVALSVDAGPAGKPLAFKTCLPAGCIVPATLDASTVAALRSAQQLKLTAKPVVSNAKPLVFSISLKGFGAALDRAAAIQK